MNSLLAFLRQLHPTTQQITFAATACVGYLVSKHFLQPDESAAVTTAIITICTVFTARQQAPQAASLEVQLSQVPPAGQGK